MDKISGKTELSYMDMIIIALIILLGIMLISRTKKKQESFVSITPQIKQEIEKIKNGKTDGYIENLLKDDKIMRNTLQDFITSNNLDKSFEDKSLYQQVVSDKPDLEQYFKTAEDIPEFKFEPNKPFAFDRLSFSDYKTVEMELKKQTPESVDFSGASNDTTPAANGFSYDNLSQSYLGELDMNDSGAMNVFESQAGF
jgi:hypothetical protein